ncbi:hypothetical protein HDV03_005182 [Kappamyces sp. JEL0829]|nr:hypothetical protein HDV03_005182 [Kappamyces sp. JEL0829]KAJ3328803.1 hypothetical protein HDU91_004022 [Kappamyces sp. JEL0680]
MSLDIVPDLVKAHENQEFKMAVKRMSEGRDTWPKDILLQGYALVKQATEGDCNLPHPGLTSIRDNFRYAAWQKVKGTSPSDATQQFLDFLADKP